MSFFQEKAILSVGAIVSNYSTDQNYPVFGFGGNPPGSDVSALSFLKYERVRVHVHVHVRVHVRVLVRLRVHVSVRV